MASFGLALQVSAASHPAPEGHPERPTRLYAISEELQKAEWRESSVEIEPVPVTPEILTAVHSTEYVENLQSFGSEGIHYIDPDTYRSKATFEASCAVTGLLLGALRTALGEGPTRSFILGRPPGHHAERNRAMGFCLVNHIAVAAEYARNQLGARRVAIFDFDIHHGNGTQHLFYDRGDVLYLSIHQYPFYPGTGAMDEYGEGEGDGFNRNFPCRAGLEDQEYLQIVERQVAPGLIDYGPDLILVSAGFDGHRFDPLGGFDLTDNAYHETGRILKETAEQVCGGKLVSLCEGGYSPEGNLDGITNYLRGLEA